MTENESSVLDVWEPAELSKAPTRGSLSGAWPRTRSKTTLIAHLTPTGEPQTCGTRAFFRGPHRRFPRPSPTENLIVGSVLQRTRFSARVVTEFLGSRCLTRASVSKKCEAKRTSEVACQLWRRGAVGTPTLHSVISPPRVRFRFAECVS